MRVRILFRESRKGEHRFSCTSAEFAPSIVQRTKMQPDWSQIVWFRLWLKWQLHTRNAPIPAALRRFPDLDFNEYCHALSLAGIRHTGFAISSLPHPKHEFARSLRAASRWHGLAKSPGSESGMEFIDITNYQFGDIQFMIALTIEAGRGHFYCSHCDVDYQCRVLTGGKWMAPLVKNTGASGRQFACPKGHLLFGTMDRIH